MDLVTDVEVTRSYVKLVFNGDEAMYVAPKVMRARPMDVGDELDLAEYRQWLIGQQYPNALDDAVRALGVRARSTQEIRSRLEAKRYLPDVVDVVLYKLEKKGLLDDEAFAREWAQSRAGQKLGRQRIYQELRQKGVASDAATAACDALDEADAAQAARDVADKLLRRYVGEEDERKTVQRVIQAMMRRGFPYDVASDALQSAIEAMAQEDDESLPDSI